MLVQHCAASVVRSNMASGLVEFRGFTFDPSTGDLLRGGRHRLRMPQQTSHLLRILVERAGTVVTREELQELLWPDGEHVDYEHAINRVVTHLRSILRDDPREPRYVETVRKRGYRFLARVEIKSQSQPVLIPEVQVAQAQPFLESLPDAIPERVQDSVPQVLTPALQAPAKIVSSRHAASLHRPKLYLLLSVALLIVAVAAGGLLWRNRPRNPAVPESVNLGIAPFLSETAEAEAIGESFRLDLADAFSQLPGVQVRATNSLANLNRDNDSIRKVSESLHLDLLLLGKFNMHGDRCTMLFELVRGRDSLHLASYQYEASREEISKIRDRLQQDLFFSIRGREHPVQAVRGSTLDPEAYSEYLKARELSTIRDPNSLTQSIAHYEQALKRDPSFAQAYAGMATAHLGMRYFNPDSHQKQAQELANKAIALDSQLAEAHAVLGDVAFRADWDFARAEDELRHAVALEPHRAIYHAWLAGLLADEGRAKESLAEIDQAIAEDPLWPSIYSMASYVDGAARDYARMIDAVQRYVRLVPDSAYCHDQMAWAYFSARRYADAIAEWKKMAMLDHDPARLALEEQGHDAFLHAGIHAYATVRIKAIESHAIALNKHPNDFVPAEWYAFNGESDKAIALLRPLIQTHDGEAVQLAVNPMFDNLHSDPRFLELVHRVGLSLPELSKN